MEISQVQDQVSHWSPLPEEVFAAFRAREHEFGRHFHDDETFRALFERALAERRREMLPTRPPAPRAAPEPEERPHA